MSSFYGAVTEIRPELKWWRKRQDGYQKDMISCQISQEEEIKRENVN